MAKPKKTPRPKAEPPKGFRDYLGAEVTARADMLGRIAEVYRLHGFEPLESSAVETVEALGSFLPDTDRPNEGVFAWEDDGTWLALRYDLTAPLARLYAQNRQDLPTPFRRYAMGPVWRNEKPGPGRFRQFYQCDADTVGSASPAADAEMCTMVGAALQAAGIAADEYRVRLNDRRILDGVLERAGLLDPADPEAGAERRSIVTRAVDKLDRLGRDGVRALLGEGRTDESGDFTQGAKLSGEQADIVIGLTESGRDDVPATLRELSDLVGNAAAGRAGLDALSEIAALTDGAAAIDPSVVRGLGYYTGPVFEAELTFEVAGPDGQPRRFGSVAGGGRYDGLVRRFTGQAVPATGVSIGVDRLLAALAAARDAPAQAGPVVVTVMDRDRMGAYQAMAAELRSAGIRAEVYLGNPKTFGAQLRYADRRASPAAIIEGDDERTRGVVQIKDLALGARLAGDLGHDEWRAQPAQSEVPRADLVPAIRRLLSA